MSYSSHAGLTNPQTLKSLLRRYNIEPTKYLGQNFLVDEQALKDLVEASNITQDDLVIEVGAGIGTITIELAKLSKKVIAVEKDKNLIPALTQSLMGLNNVKVLNKDILKFDHLDFGVDWSLVIGHWSLVGNIPYYLTAPLLRKFLEAENQPKLIVLMVQKEVAERICAAPPDMSILAISVQVYAKPEIVTLVSRTSFWPTPKVDSAILKISPIEENPLKSNLALQKTFFKIVRAGFSSPRKQLLNNFINNLHLDREYASGILTKTNIDPTRRAETLSVDEWERLSASMV